MRRLLPNVPILLFLAAVGGNLVASSPVSGLETLTTTQSVHSLTPEKAARAYPVHLRAVVTYYDPYIDFRHGALFVSDETGAIFVATPAQPILPFRSGMVLDINGQTGAGDFAPVIENPRITIIGKSHLPDHAPLVSMTRLETGAEDGQWVEVEGVARSVMQHEHNVFTEIQLGDGRLVTTTVAQPGVDYTRLIDAEVRVRGNAVPIFAHKGQMLGARLFFQTLDQWQILKPAPTDPYVLPVQRIDAILRYTPGVSVRHRIHVRGQVTLFWPGQSICIQDQSRGLCVQTAETMPVVLGDWVDLAGFPTVTDYAPTMTDAVYRSSGAGPPVKPRNLTVPQALFPERDSEVIEITGELIGQDLGASASEPSLLLSAGSSVFSVVLPPGTRSAALSDARQGSQLRVTGICSVVADATQTKSYFGPLRSKSFRLLLRSPADVLILTTPPWWTAGRALLVLGLVVAFSIGSMAWGVILRRRVRQQTEVIQRQLDEAGALQDAAEAANRVKSEFLANMSHEIRTPMNGVMGMLDLAIEDSASAAQRDYLELARDSADTLLTVINDILDFSKIEAGKLDLVSAPFDLRELLDQIARSFARRAAEKNIRLLYDVDSHAPWLVIADRVRICQVITNLVGNAVKFTERGEVTLKVLLKERKGQRAVLGFVVSDSGIGIARDKQTKIFESFAQVDSSLSRSYGGTGLGLAISSSLVKLMSGSIGVESELGKGSRFHFTIEVEALDEGDQRKPHREADYLNGLHQLGRPFRGLQVLLAEDNEVNQRVVRIMLESRGHSVTSVADGLQAVELSDQRNFDVILMDVSMPIMDGLEATAEIRRRERESGRHLPIIALTAHAMTGDKERCLQAGMDGYLAKPIKANEIVEAMRALLPDAATV